MLRTLGVAVAVVEDVGPHAPARVPIPSAPWLRVLPWSWTRWLASDRVLLARRR